MQCEEYLEDAFALTLLGGVDKPPEPMPASYYNEDGDCVEIRLSNESYYAERCSDGLVTLFIGRESSQVVGAVIKNVKRLLESVLESAPGFRFEISDVNGTKVEHLLSVCLWSGNASPYDDCIVKKYKYLREAAESNHLRVNLSELTLK